MNKDLIMRITDAVAHVIRRYDLEVGPRALVELVTEVSVIAEEHTDAALFGEVEESFDPFSEELDDLFAETTDPIDDLEDEFDQGVRFGSQFGERAKIEIYDSAFDEGFYAAGGTSEGLDARRALEGFDADEIDFEDGFRAGLEQAG